MLISHQQVHLSTVGTSKGRCNCKAVPGPPKRALRPATKPLSIVEARESSASWSIKAKKFTECLRQLQPQWHIFEAGKKAPERVCIQGVALSSTSSPPHADTPYTNMKSTVRHQHGKVTSNLCGVILQHVTYSSTTATLHRCTIPAQRG